MTSTQCPERKDLERALLGLLPELQSEQIEQHLLGCERCLATLAGLDAGDTLVEAMRAGPAAAAEMAEYRDQAKRIAERWITPPGGGADTTPSESAAGEATSEFDPRRTLAPDGQDEEIDFLAPSQSPDELGRLGNYRVFRVLGTGGMGVVFEAEDLQLKRRVALKAMKPSLAASASSRKRFLREAQTAASVEHDHIVPIYQVGDDRGIPFIAMPLLRGETLAERLIKGSGFGEQQADHLPLPPGEGGLNQIAVGSDGEPQSNASSPHLNPLPEGEGTKVPPTALPLAEMIRIGREIATGLDAAHRAGLIHRDIKPGNIWLEATTGRVKILDFGLARAASADEHLTQAGALLGTPSYMAPEQGRGEEVDARADLFSLGCVLYQMATRVRPFIGRDPLATLLAVTTQHPRPPRELNPDLPGALSDLIMSLLAKEPADRPQTAAEVAARLEAVARASSLVPDDSMRGRLTNQATATAAPPFTSAVGPADGLATLPPDDLSATQSPSAEAALVGARGARAPRHRRPLAVAAATAAAALVLGVVIIIKDREGNVVATVKTDGPAEVEAASGIKVELKPTDGEHDDTAPTQGDRSPHAPRGENHAERGTYGGRNEVAPADAAAFAIQGEYLGEVVRGGSSNKIGAQVIALPAGAFRAVIYEGGLPGDGWRRRQSKETLEGTLESDVADFVGGKYSAQVRDGRLTLVDAATKSAITLEKAQRTSPTLGAKPPPNALVLFNGTAAEKFADGQMTPDKLLIPGTRTKQSFGDCTLHLEFRLPFMRNAEGQERGNSGCYLQGRYELQILDSFGLDGDISQCGAVYSINEPAVNMCFPPLTWQTYDVEYTAARYDSTGKKLRDARATVRHNGVLVQNNTVLTNTTVGFVTAEGPEAAPLYLQDHGSPVRFRNIWIVDASKLAEAEPRLQRQPAPSGKREENHHASNPKSKIQNPKSLSPLSPLALVTEPAEIEGLKSWTLETIGHRGRIHEAEYSPDGKWLATRGDDGTIRFWNPASGKLARILVGHDQGLGLLAWSADGAQLAAIDAGAVRLWEAGAGKLLKTLPIEPASALFQAAWSPDGKTMAVGLARNVDGQRQHLLELIELESGEVLESRPTSWREPNVGCWQPQNLCWSPDSTRLAFNSTILRVESGQAQSTAGTLGESFAWRADGALLTAPLVKVGDDWKVQLWRADTGEMLSTLSDYTWHVYGDYLPQPRFSSAGDALVAAPIAYTGRPCEAYVWDTTTCETIKKCPLTPYTAFADFRVARQAVSVASIGWAGELRIINLTGGEPATLHRYALTSSRSSFVAAWSPSGNMLAARDEDERICLWDLAARRRHGLIPCQRGLPDSVTWHADEPLLDAWLRTGDALRKAVIDGDAGNVRRYEDFDGTLAAADLLSSCGPASAVAHTDRVRIFAGDPPRLLREVQTASKLAPALSRDGRRLATIADKTTIWNVADGKPLASFDVAAPVEWSPDGERLAYTFANGERFEVRDAESGELLTELRVGDPESPATQGPMVAAGARLAWSHDGSRLAGFGRVWNATSGEIVCDLQRFDRQSNVGQPAWSPDGAYLAYRAHDGALCIADAIKGQVVDNLFSFTRGRALAVSPRGHYRASPRVDSELVYVIETDAGQETLSPPEFADKYGWRNDPSLAGMAGKAEGKRQKAETEITKTEDLSPKTSPLNPKSLSPLALVQQPAELPGVESWSLESRTPQVVAPEWLYQHAALHPDGQILAAGGTDGNVRIYDLFGGKTPRLTRFLLGHTSPIAAIEWSPDGKWLATAERGRPSVRVWNPATGKCLAEGLASCNTLWWLHWSPDGRTIAVCGDGGASLLDAQTAELMLPVDVPGGVVGISWSPDAVWIALQVSSSIAIRDAITGETPRSLFAPGGDFMTGAVAWSPDGKSITCASQSDVYVWSAADGALVKRFTVPDLFIHVPPIAWFDEGAKLRVLTTHGSEVWDVAAGAKASDDPLPGVYAVRSANGRAIAQLDAARDWSITVYDRVSKKRHSVETRCSFTAATWSPDGRALAAASGLLHPRVHVWTHGEPPKLEALPAPGIGNNTVLLNWLDGDSLLDAHGGTEVAVFSRGTFGWQSRLLGIATWASRQPLAAVSADGMRLACVPYPSDGKTARTWEVKDGKPFRDVTEADAQTAALALSPNGDRLACFNTDGGLVIWETATGRRQHQARLWPKDRFINEALISWSPDGKQIALSTHDGVVRLMDDQLNIRRELAGHDYGQDSFGATTLRFSDDGQTLHTADARKIRVWNTETGDLLRATPHGLPYQAFPVMNSWRFSPDQSRLVTTGSSARVWDAATGRLQATLVGLRDGEGVVVSPDGHYLCTPKAESDLVYIVRTADGQELLSPKEFAAKYGWKNDPTRVSTPN